MIAPTPSVDAIRLTGVKEAASDRASLPDRGRMAEMRCEFFVFADGPWQGRIIDNPFEADGLLPASSLLIAGGPLFLRYVLTAGRRTFADGGTGAIYRFDPASTLTSSQEH